MQDFIKPLAAANAAPTAKRKWLTKDRFWNFVFWFGMSFGLGVAHFTRANLEIPVISKLMYVFTLIGIPVLISFFNKTLFIKKDTFVNSENNIITERQMPYSFPLAAMSGLGVAFIVAYTVLPKGAVNLTTSLVNSISLFSGISLYFIFKNCPISILFNRKFWTFEFRTGSLTRHSEGSSSSRSPLSGNANPIHSSSSGGRSYDHHRYSPSYSHLPQNIHRR